jgi:hypothetical protein
MAREGGGGEGSAAAGGQGPWAGRGEGQEAAPGGGRERLRTWENREIPWTTMGKVTGEDGVRRS